MLDNVIIPWSAEWSSDLGIKIKIIFTAEREGWNPIFHPICHDGGFVTAAERPAGWDSCRMSGRRLPFDYRLWLPAGWVCGSPHGLRPWWHGVGARRAQVAVVFWLAFPEVGALVGMALRFVHHVGRGMSDDCFTD